MIVSSLVDLFISLLRASISGFEIIGLPLQTINSLTTIMAYGVWIVGIDIMTIFTATVVFWWVLKLVVGLALWLWDLLPLT